MLGFSPDRVWPIKPKEKAIFGLEASFEGFLKSRIVFLERSFGARMPVLTPKGPKFAAILIKQANSCSPCTQ